MSDEQEIALNINVTTAENITAIDISAKINLNLSNLLKLSKKETQSIKNNEMQVLKNVETTLVKKTYKNALLIGCNYKNSRNELFGCINDANNIKQALTKTYGFDNIELMTDDTPKKPTKKNILAEIKYLLNSANSGDILFLSFSGHGINLKDRNGDEKDGLDEVIVPIDFEYIIDDELNRLILENLKKDVTLFALFDCCHSGTILDLRYQYLDSTSFDKDTEHFKHLETEGNVIMISGCMDSQTSIDAYIRSAGTYQGVMTLAFLESIKQRPNLSWNDLLASMRDNLNKSGYEQIPQLSSGKKLDLTRNFLSA
jgi:hypothetical protein